MPGRKMYDLQAKYENYVVLTTCQGTARRYAKALTQFFSRFEDKKSPDEFTRLDMEDFRILRMREGVTARTVNYEVQVVRGYWNWLIRMGEADYNPASTVRRLKEIEPQRNSIAELDQDKLYQTAASTGNAFDAILVGLALSTGLRAESLVKLEKSEIDFPNKALRIPADKMKSGRNHEIPLRDHELKLLEGLPDGRIFEGYAKNAASLSYHFSRLCRRAGLPWRGLRTARRTFATTLLRKGANLRTVADLLAHRNITTTSRYLTPADAKETREAVMTLPGPKEKGPDELTPGPNPSI